MPTYDYVCDKCGHQFEKFQSMKDSALTTCLKESCGQKRWGKGKIRRLMGTGAGLIFKGSGFYITDYRDKSYADKAKADNWGSADSKSDSKAETKSEGSSESKSDAKSDSKATETKSGETKSAETKSKSTDSKPATSKPEPKASKSASKSGRKK